MPFKNGRPSFSNVGELEKYVDSLEERVTNLEQQCSKLLEYVTQIAIREEESKKWIEPGKDDKPVGPFGD